jgi:pimeloyl-ACP methyl ester carboxylesterase
MIPRVHTWLAPLLAVLFVMVTSCSSTDAAVEKYDYFRITVDGQQTLGVSGKDKIVRGVVIFFHGLDGDEFSVSSERVRRDFTAQLVDAGFAVVSSAAGGNAFGNPSSRQNYLYLGGEAANHYHTENFFLVAESMGALAAVNLMASLQSLRFRGLAAINPILDISTVPTQYKSEVDRAYPNGSFEDSNPINLPLDRLRDTKMRFYVSEADSLVPVAQNALAFKARFGYVSNISVVKCVGGTGGESCFQGQDVVKWFTEVEKRNQ